MHGNKQAAYFHQHQKMETSGSLVSAAPWREGRLQLRDSSHHRLIRFKNRGFIHGG
jgi:hypothetical protein